MADKKISALPASSTPLAGTEVLPIVQGGATTQVSVANLTAGRAISVTSVTASTGNFVVGTSGQGIDFSATPGTGTSELLSDYEEGTWTPTLTADVNFTSVSYNAITEGVYTKIGRVVNFYCTVYTTSITVGPASGSVYISGLPFTSSSAPSGGGLITACQVWAINTPLYGEVLQSGTRIALGKRLAVNGATSAIEVTDVGTGSSNFVRISGSYQV
jgi:hypothetical protein